MQTTSYFIAMSDQELSHQELYKLVLDQRKELEETRKELQATRHELDEFRSFKRTAGSFFI